MDPRPGQPQNNVALFMVGPHPFIGCDLRRDYVAMFLVCIEVLTGLEWFDYCPVILDKMNTPRTWGFNNWIGGGYKKYIEAIEQQPNSPLRSNMSEWLSMLRVLDDVDPEQMDKEWPEETGVVHKLGRMLEAARTMGSDQRGAVYHKENANQYRGSPYQRPHISNHDIQNKPTYIKTPNPFHHNRQNNLPMKTDQDEPPKKYFPGTYKAAKNQHMVLPVYRSPTLNGDYRPRLYSN